MKKSKSARVTANQSPHPLSREEALYLTQLFGAGRYVELETRARLLIDLHPEAGLPWKIFGTSLLVQGKDALSALQKAASLLPHDAEVHSNLGTVLRNLGRHDEAAESYRRALQCKPEAADAHYNLGIALRDASKLNEALACHRRAVQLKPSLHLAHNNLGIALQELGRLPEALDSYRQALHHQSGFTEPYSNLLFASNYLPGLDAEALLADAKGYGQLLASRVTPFTTWSNTPDAHRPLRVGLVSGDLRGHPVGYFVEGVLSALSRQADANLVILAYANHVQKDGLTERIRACCQVWRDVAHLPDRDLANLIRQDGVDILIDLSGHSAYNRLPLFALKPAPVQATWVGYFATTGVSAIDYFLADPWTVPPSEEAFFTETVWRLPETRLCFTPPDVMLQPAPLPALSQGHVTFGCFNNLTKLNDEVVALWAQVLQSVDGSRLFLKSRQLGDVAVVAQTQARFAQHGIDAARLRLEGYSSREDYLAAYGCVDISLDPFPFTGGTTSAESLWMGVPVLTLAGRHLVARQGVGLMMNAGLPDYVANDAQDYVDRAIRLSADLPALARLRAGLRAQVQQSPVFDAARFAGHLVVALRGMWVRWCATQQASMGNTVA
jgi:predicted O-linked N-acetylglucosamine transferase (SPINDLY family)